MSACQDPTVAVIAPRVEQAIFVAAVGAAAFGALGGGGIDLNALDSLDQLDFDVAADAAADVAAGMAAAAAGEEVGAFAALRRLFGSIFDAIKPVYRREDQWNQWNPACPPLLRRR